MEPIVNFEGYTMMQDSQLCRSLLNDFYNRMGYEVYRPSPHRIMICDKQLKTNFMTVFKKRLKFKVEYDWDDDGVYILYQRKKFLFFWYWDRISSAKSIDYLEKIISNLNYLNNISGTIPTKQVIMRKITNI